MEDIKEQGGGSSVTTQGHSTPNSVKTFSDKNAPGPSVWKKIGRLERVGEGARITLSPFGDDQIVYLTRRELAKITSDRMPGDLVTITETPQEIITAIVGKAFRSRTGRALMIRVPYCSGDAMAPWQTFIKVMEGRQAAAPVSIIEKPLHQHRYHPTETHSGPF